MIASIDNNPPLDLEHLYVDSIKDVYERVDKERYFVAVRYGMHHYYIDKLESYVIRDMSRTEDEGMGQYYKRVAGPFESIQAALDYPLLDGKSIRERFDEVEFLTD